MRSGSSTEWFAASHKYLAHSLAGATMLLLVAACGADTEPDASPPVTMVRPDAVAPTTPSKRDPSADMTANIKGSLQRQFALGSLELFAEHPSVVDVVEGTVIRTQVAVLRPGNEVETWVTVKVDRRRGTDTADILTTAEPGGVVTADRVRDEFESKTGRHLTDDELAKTIDYRYEGVEHSKVGDQVLLFLGSSTGRAGVDYTTMASLTRATGAADYTWPGRAPNEKWQAKVDQLEMTPLLARRVS